jgi:hypothetical protein
LTTTDYDPARDLAEAGVPVRVATSAAPLRSGILGITIGILVGSAFAVLTIAHLTILPRDAWHIGLLGNYLAGYRVSPAGVLIAFAWGSVIGFAAGWLLAATRNAAMRLWMEIVRAKANLGRSDFLDGI